MKGRFAKWEGGDEAPSEDAPAADFPEVWQAGTAGDLKIKIAVSAEGFDKPDELEHTICIDDEINKHVFVAYSNIFQSMEFESLTCAEGASIEVHNGIEWDHFKSVVALGALVDDLIENIGQFDYDSAAHTLEAWERDLANGLEKVKQALVNLKAEGQT